MPDGKWVSKANLQTFWQMVKSNLAAFVTEDVSNVLPTIVPEELSKVLPTMVGEQIDNKFGDDIGDDVTSWLTEHVNPAGSAVVVDDTLTIAGAAADAKKTGSVFDAVTEGVEFATATPNATQTNSGVTFETQSDGSIKLYGTATATRKFLCLNGQNNTAVNSTSFSKTLDEGLYEVEMAATGTLSTNVSWLYTYSTFASGNIAVTKTLPKNTICLLHPAMVGFNFESGTNFGTEESPTYITFSAKKLSAVDFISRGFTEYYTLLENGSDLDTITLPGMYKTLSASDTQTIKHKPEHIVSAFALKVITVNNENRLLQVIYFNSDSPNVLIRNRNNDNIWSGWTNVTNQEYIENAIGQTNRRIGMAACTWEHGSMYIDTGEYYATDTRVLTSCINVSVGDSFTILMNGEYVARVYKFIESSGTTVYVGCDAYDKESSFVVDSTYNQIYVNILKSNGSVDVEDVFRDIEIIKRDGSVFEKYRMRLVEQSGIIPVVWERGGIYNADGTEYDNIHRIRTQILPKPANGIVYITVPIEYIMRMLIYKEENGSINYISGYMGLQYTNYTTNFAIKIPDYATHYRIQIMPNEDPETTTLDIVDDGRKIVVYTDTSIVDYGINDELCGYVIDESNRTADLYNAISSNKDFSFIAISDLHYWHNNGVVKRALNDMANGVEYIAAQCDFDYFIGFGDYIYRFGNQYKYVDGRAEIMASQRLVNRCFKKEGVPQIRLVGNHDPNSLQLNNGQLEQYFSMSDLYKYIGRFNTTFTVDPENPTGSYGYIDNTEKKIRVICLNTSDFTDEGHPPVSPNSDNPDVNNVNTYVMSVRQIQWFINSLKMVGVSDPETWNIFIISHVPITGTSGDLYDSIGNNLWILVDEYKNRRSGSITVKGQTLSYDYSDVTPAYVLPYMHGHVHAYTIDNANISNTAGGKTNGDIVKISVSNALPYRDNEFAKVSMTKDSTTFCIVKIDIEHRIVYVLHYGSGSDMIIHYESLSVLTTATVTSVYGNVEWKSANTNIATVRNGVITKASAGNVLIIAKQNNGNREIWNVKTE